VSLQCLWHDNVTLISTLLLTYLLTYLLQCEQWFLLSYSRIVLRCSALALLLLLHYCSIPFELTDFSVLAQCSAVQSVAAYVWTGPYTWWLMLTVSAVRTLAQRLLLVVAYCAMAVDIAAVSTKRRDWTHRPIWCRSSVRCICAFYRILSNRSRWNNKMINTVAYYYFRFLPLDAMDKRGQCHRAVSVRPSVCLSVLLSVTFVYCIKTSNHILKLFSRLNSHTILVSPDQFLRPCSYGDPLTVASNAVAPVRYEKSAIFHQYFALPRKRYKIGW